MSFHEEETPENHERWLLTYADLITLLMIFFVVMYAMSNVDAKKYSALSNSLTNALDGSTGMLDNQGKSIAEPLKEPNQSTTGEQNKLKEVQKQLEQYLEKNNLQKEVTMAVEERGLVISLKDTLVFDIGQAVVRTETQNKIIEIGKILNQLQNYIRIEGHTDNIPIHNANFNSNWELSAIRATNVTQLLINYSYIAPQRLAAVGYGEFRPIVDNSTEAGRIKNRRVDIIILNSKFNQVENNNKKK